MKPRTFLRAHIDVCRENEELHRTVRVLTLEKVHDLALVSSLRDQLARLRADVALIEPCLPPSTMALIRDYRETVDALDEGEPA